MKTDKVNIDKLQTVKNFSLEHGVTTSYIYKLEKEGRMNLYLIDGVKFVQTDIYAGIPVNNRRK